MLKGRDWKNVLKGINNYTWQDIVRLSIEDNISIRRFIQRQFKDFERYEVDELVNFIDDEIKKTITIQ